jgi:hypothetical protein
MSEAKRPGTVISVVLAGVALVMVIVIVLVLSGGGGDDAGTTPTPAPADALNGSAAAPGLAGALPPGFVECMEDRGIDAESITSDQIHSPEGDACFQSIH